MSNVNIRRAVENIKSGINVYTPLVELVVNAIQAIEMGSAVNGKVEVLIKRAPQMQLDSSSVPEVTGFTVKDNGIGFTDKNRESFDTLYSAHKIDIGGKGFGRFTCLKYFEDLIISSNYISGDTKFNRSFKMGKKNDIIENEKIAPTEFECSGTTAELKSIKGSKFNDRKHKTIARTLFEKLLPYFCTDGYQCPIVELKDECDGKTITLNEFLKKEGRDSIVELPTFNQEFVLSENNGEQQAFIARVFKFYSPKQQKSQVNLVAHKRTVTSTQIQNYIPEFAEEFSEKSPSGATRNFILKVYVFSSFLDEHVSLERGNFDFHKDHDLQYGISQSQIEEQAVKTAHEVVSEEVDERTSKKQRLVVDYISEEAPWHTQMLDTIDLSNLPMNPSEEQIELTFQKAKFNVEGELKKDVKAILASEDNQSLHDKATDILGRISESNKNDLAHYVALRRSIIDIFKKSLEANDDGKFSSEGVVHDIIFPRKGDSIKTPFQEHNLWLIDERLNFTEYLSSDLPLEGHLSDRPDLLAYDKRVVFRGENEPSNPVMVFEFKKPKRNDFANASTKDDPVKQIIRYIRKIKNGDFETPEGREINIENNTPFYGYVVCDFDKKVRTWLEEEHDFTPMPDRKGYFKWHANLNLYIEVLSWDKLLKDADMRNKVFFHQLGIN
ncbi:ATP-binding protein [Colwellia sp. D2M02]|uniref:ATP-binding protein n=1 Tax=Colwellia sp. D2M02 TaxID=2841562 RepID=UPI001C081294|nr:ATP-binding protein [Colwellia sp. D2M02]MBU2894946.1 ATP-binding protein [Colwellia sp. D2M02]